MTSQENTSLVWDFDHTVCGNLTVEYWETWKQYEFWCEGVLFSCLGLFGLISNMTSIVTLLSNDMRKHTFNKLLAVLAMADIMFIIFNVPVHANAIFEFVSAHFSGSYFLSQLYVNFLYPMSAVSFCLSTYMTLAVTVERFIAVCRPHQHRNIAQTLSRNMRVMIYVTPVTIMAFIFNIPKFLEVTIAEKNGTNEVDSSETRRDPTYIYLHIIHTLTTGVLPFLGLGYMNLRIFNAIRSTRVIQSGQTSRKRQSEITLSITLTSIVLKHLLCNILRIYLCIMLVFLLEDQVSCMANADHYIPPLLIMCLESVAHLLVMFNFSTNFIIYCFVSKQFKTELMKGFCNIYLKAVKGSMSLSSSLRASRLKFGSLKYDRSRSIISTVTDTVDEGDGAVRM